MQILSEHGVIFNELICTIIWRPVLDSNQQSIA